MTGIVTVSIFFGIDKVNSLFAIVFLYQIKIPIRVQIFMYNEHKTRQPFHFGLLYGIYIDIQC